MQYIMGPDYTDPEKVIKKLMELRTKESHAKPYEKYEIVAKNFFIYFAAGLIFTTLRVLNLQQA